MTWGVNGHYPLCIRYGISAANNSEKYTKAAAQQGPEVKDNKLWWAKKERSFS